MKRLNFFFFNLYKLIVLLNFILIVLKDEIYITCKNYISLFFKYKTIKIIELLILYN